MPRFYKPSGKFTQYDINIMNAAVDSVRIGELSVNKAAEKFNIKRSTLQNRVKGKHSKKQGGQCALSESDEQRLKNMLLTTSHWGFPLTKIDLRHITKSYLDNSNKTILVFKNNFPGDDWAQSFLGRHKLSLRNGQNIAPNRAAVTMEMMSNYFENLEKAIKDIPPENIANYDETNFTDNPGSRKVIFRRGVKYPENVLANSKSSTSVMFCGTAAGLVLPIYVVYKAINVYDTWIENGPPGARYNATSHGWFESSTFLDWFRTIYIPHARTLIGPKVIIGDNLSSHISEEVIELARKENVLFICLPANCTHIAQPLDVTFFGPLKRVWRKILWQFKMSHPTERVVPKDVFPTLMKELWESIAEDNKAEANLKAGFRTCGIFPLDKDQVLKKMDKKVVPGISADDGKVLSDAVLDYMKLLREPLPLQRRARKKKVSTAPGQSICIDDFIHTEPVQKKRRKVVPPKPIRKKNVRKAPIRRTTTKAASSKVRKAVPHQKLKSSVVPPTPKRAVRKALPRQNLVSSVFAPAANKVDPSTVGKVLPIQKVSPSPTPAAIKPKSSSVRKAVPRQKLVSSNEIPGSQKSVCTRSSSRNVQ